MKSTYILTVSLISVLTFLIPCKVSIAQDACSRTEYYDGCGNLYWSTGSQSCSNVIKVYMDFECDT